MRSHIPFVTSLVILVALSTTPAQPPPATLGLHESAWPLPWTGAFSGGAVGHFMGEQRPCALAMRGQHAVFQPFAAVCDSHVTIPELANDVTTCSDAGAPGNTDAVILVGPGGVFRCWLGSTGAPPVVQPIDTSPAFQGAQLVSSGDVNGDGNSDLVVVLADRATIRTMLGQGNGQWVTGTTQTAPATIQDLQLARWFVGQPLKVVLSTTLGLYVGEPMSRRWRSYLSVPSLQREHDAFAVVSTTATPPLPDSVAYVTASYPTGSDQTLFVFDSFSTTPHVILPLTQGVTGISAADLDGDGDGEVVTVGDSATEVVVRWNQAIDPQPAAQQWFEESYRTVIGLGPSGRPNPGAGVPLLADLNLDGVIDIVAHSDVDNLTFFADGSTLGFDTDSGADLSFGDFCVQPTGGKVRLNVHADLASNWTTFEIGIYHSEGLGLDFDPVPVRLCRVDADPALSVHALAVELGDGQSLQDWRGSADFYSGFVRPVQYDGQTITDSGPILAFTFSGTHGALSAVAWPGAETYLSPIEPCSGSPSGGGDCLGIIRSRPNVVLPPELPPNTTENPCGTGTQ